MVTATGGIERPKQLPNARHVVGETWSKGVEGILKSGRYPVAAMVGSRRADDPPGPISRVTASRSGWRLLENVRLPSIWLIARSENDTSNRTRRVVLE